MNKLLTLIVALLLLTPVSSLGADQSEKAAGGFVDYSGRPPYIYTGEREPLPGPVVSAVAAREADHLTEVVLVGKIVSVRDHDFYELRDNTGRLPVKILPDRWNGLTVGPNDVVVIRGKVDRLADPVAVEATRIHTRNYYYALTPPAPGSPLPIGVVSVEQALTMPNTAPLALEGQIEKKLEPGRLLFRDHSGAIVLNVDEANPLVAGPYSPGDLMVVEGRVDSSRTPTEIDVETIVDRSNFAPMVVEVDTVCESCGRPVVEEETVLVPVPVN